MAALAFSFVGTAVAGPLGGMVGNVLGSVLDGILFPSPKPNINQNIQISTYGTTIPRCYGPTNRISGNIIWWSGYRKQPVNIGLEILKALSPLAAVFSSKTGQPGYECDVAIALCAGEDVPGDGKGIVQIRKIWANETMIFNADYRDGLVFVKGDVDGDVMSVIGSVHIYQGTFAQDPDGTIEAALGIGNTPAFRGTAYVVLGNLLLADFGNTMPNMEILVEAHESIDLSQVVQDVAARAGIPPNSISASGVAGNAVEGFTIGQQFTARDAISPLQLAYGFDSADQFGNLRFIPRGLPPRGYVNLDELAGHVPTDARPEPIHFTRDTETLLPNQVVIIYSDRDFSFQPNSQTAIRTGGSSDANMQTQVPIVLHDNHAQQVADRILWEAWNGRTKATTTVGDRWLREVRPGLVYTFDTPVGPEPLRITRVTRGANALIELELSRDYAEVYTTPTPGSSALLPNEQVEQILASNFQPMDCPLLADADDNTGFYFAVDGEGSGAWRGADVQRSMDGGVSFTEVAPIGARSVMGTVAAATPAGPTCFFDTGTVITVSLDDPTAQLQSVTQLDVLNGVNPFWLGPASGEGGEILQFTDALETSPGVYQLSGLLRGRQGTEYAVGSHGSAERLVMLAVNFTKRPDFGVADWNKTREYQAVTALAVSSSAEPQNFTNTGEGKNCKAPVHPSGVRDGSNNLTIAWVRRSRLAAPGLGNGLVPLGESTELYSIDIVVSSVVVRTLAATTPSVAYSAADQTADGITPGDAVSGNIYQISDVRGRGHACPFTV